mmetsp:Transcript_14481/g.34193  ORF Transcript_14481/g.34193 Transcript_14481/m.34193 type:complete len:922 (-) Transcript_14481:189-2954(-)
MANYSNNGTSSSDSCLISDVIDEDDTHHAEALENIGYACLLNGAQVLLMIGGLVLLLVLLPRTRIATAPRCSVSKGSFSEWLKEAWPSRSKDSQLSPDGLILVRLCELGFTFSCAGSLVGCVLVPIYYTGEADYDDFLQYTLLNIGEKDYWRSWASLVGGVLLVLIALFLLHREWKEFVLMRRNHLRRRAEGLEGPEAAQAQLSVMVENLPADMRNEPALRKLFEDLLGPAAVHSVVVQGETLAIHRKLAKTAKSRIYHGLKGRQEGKPADEEENRRDVQRSEAAPHSTSSHLQKEESRTHFREAMRKAMAVEQNTMYMLQKALDGSRSSTGFVTLTECRAHAIAEQVILFNAMGEKSIQLTSDVCQVSAAPEARDVIWRNAAIPLGELKRRRWIGLSMCAVGLFFWALPVSSVQVIASMDEWHDAPQWVHDFSTSSIGERVVGYLPVLALMLLLILLPYGLQVVCDRIEGQKRKSNLQRQVLFRNLGFQIATLWCTVFSATISRTLTEIAEKPACLPKVLGKALPGQAAYFVTFIIAKIGTSLPVLVIMPVLSAFPWTATDSKGLKPTYCSYASEATQLAIVLILGFLYASISPLILPVCAVYFFLAAFVYRWLFHNVYQSEYDCMGMFWHELFDFSMAALLLGPISLAGIYATFIGPLAWQLQVIWLAPIGIISRYWSWYRLYNPLCSVLPFQDAVELDTRKLGAGSSARCWQMKCLTGEVAVTETFSSDCYIDPAMTESRSHCHSDKSPMDAFASKAMTRIGLHKDHHAKPHVHEFAGPNGCGQTSECATSQGNKTSSSCREDTAESELDAPVAREPAHCNSLQGMATTVGKAMLFDPDAPIPSESGRGRVVDGELYRPTEDNSTIDGVRAMAGSSDSRERKSPSWQLCIPCLPEAVTRQEVQVTPQPLHHSERTPLA